MDVVGQEVSYHRVTMAIAKAWGPNRSGLLICDVRQTVEPGSVRRVSHHAPVEVRRAIIPPNRPAFSQCRFSLIDGRTRRRFRDLVARLQSYLNRTTGAHEFAHEVRPSC